MLIQINVDYHMVQSKEMCIGTYLHFEVGHVQLITQSIYCNELYYILQYIRMYVCTCMHI